MGEADLRDVNKMTDTEKEVELGIDAQVRAQNCLIDIKKVLERWGCVIDPVIQITGNGITKGSYMVVPLVKRLMG